MNTSNTTEGDVITPTINVVSPEEMLNQFGDRRTGNYDRIKHVITVAELDTNQLRRMQDSIEEGLAPNKSERYELELLNSIKLLLAPVGEQAHLTKSITHETTHLQQELTIGFGNIADRYVEIAQALLDGRTPRNREALDNALANLEIFIVT